ncbi:MAG: DNA-directed RNA polymerase subunit omega [Clostridia bacterium]|nr:DNA-directed RNA polymerase subunit omega [Clostridia bacterium]MBQ9861722.1 DNA-directed RNA polymerase subunit omega [Clostridia bacterium]
MLKPTDIEQLKGKNSRYAVVIGVAKRARSIAQDAEDNGVVLTEKPVSMAILDFTEGDYKMVASND